MCTQGYGLTGIIWFLCVWMYQPFNAMNSLGRSRNDIDPKLSHRGLIEVDSKGLDILNVTRDITVRTRHWMHHSSHSLHAPPERVNYRWHKNYKDLSMQPWPQGAPVGTGRAWYQKNKPLLLITYPLWIKIFPLKLIILILSAQYHMIWWIINPSGTETGIFRDN